MGADRTRVLVLALAAIGLVVAATLKLDWFVIKMGTSVVGLERTAIDLRSVHACSAQGVCGVVPLSMIRGLYPTLATITFYTTLAFALLVAVQAGFRLMTGAASHGWSRFGYMIGILAFVNAVGTAYLFGPETGAIQDTSSTRELGMDFMISVARTWAPLMLLAAIVLGIAAMYYAVTQDSVAESVDYEAPTLASARTVSTGHVRTASDPIPVIPQERPASGLIPTVPELLRGKLKYAALTAELTRGGIDARREDGSSRLVMWRDVVGVVARRLPAAYEGLTFVDVVSTAGSTLRLLPWTRLTGDPVEGEGAARALSLLAVVAAHCPEAKLDPATRAFVDSRDQAAQLPDLETLAAHDERLA